MNVDCLTFTWRFLHCRQPLRDLVWVLRTMVFGGGDSASQ